MKIKFLQLFTATIMILVGCLSKAGAQGRTAVYDYSQAQQFLQDVAGRPLYLKVDYFVEGKPFHPENYYRATLIFSTGKVYINVPVKLNLMENIVLYTDATGQELVVINPVQKVIFTDASDNGRMSGVVFEKGFPPIDTLTEDTFYEVVDSGKITLLKHYRVYYNDRKEFGSANISRVFNEAVSYFTWGVDGKMSKMGKSKEALMELIPAAKRKLVETYIAKEDLKCRKYAEWKQVIAYFNSLE